MKVAPIRPQLKAWRLFKAKRITSYELQAIWKRQDAAETAAHEAKA